MKKTLYVAMLLLGLSTYFGACGQKQGKNNDCQNTYGFSNEEIAYHQDDYMNGEDYDSEDNYSSAEYVCHEYVDLGLPSGTLWATCNVGANTPEGYGDYFAWGETEPKNTYNWENYKHCNGRYNTLTKYNDLEELGYSGYFDNQTCLLPIDDPATANWGSDWCTPTVEQIKELCEYTRIVETKQNGIDGRLFCAENGKSIFMPASGWCFNEGHHNDARGHYWLNSLRSDNPKVAHSYIFGPRFGQYGQSVRYGEDDRYVGLSVRPVRSKEQIYKSEETHDFVDLDLPSGTLWATCNVGATTPEGRGFHFAWGETTPKSSYDWSNYNYCKGNFNQLTKYCVHSKIGYNGFKDNLTVLLAEDDAATTNWGIDWCTPGIAEWDELIDNTDSKWTTLNGVNGRLFTANNGKSLFLPASGQRSNYDQSIGCPYGKDQYGGYWSSTLNTNAPYEPCFFDFYNPDYYGSSLPNRCTGLSVRPIRSNKKTPTIHQEEFLTVEGHECVDLGLPSGTLWATFNVGAETPTDFGYYYAWGETQPKNSYSWSNYKHCKAKGSIFQFTKYCNNGDRGYDGFTDNLSTLHSVDDAATVNWGGGWRTPTITEWQELLENTRSATTTQNGVSGILFQAKNGNKVFLPAAGAKDNEISSVGCYGDYWSNSLSTIDRAYDYHFRLDEHPTPLSYRNRGLSVRPVHSR